MGLKRGGASLKDIISARWTWTSLFVDILIGLALLALWLGVEFAWSLAPWRSGAASGTLLRQALELKNAADIPLWILLSMSAGFVEELVFRGYLQKQFGALVNNIPAGVILQAVLFGVSHGYQGWEPVIRITLFGLIFGILAQLRKSLRPGMIAHALVDILGGLIR
jgi:membrane protease YdiL (CAAX protease family)